MQDLGLQVVSEPSTPSNAGVDLIFLHGITGNAHTTWLHKQSGVHWPRDLLHIDIKNARIMVWGYDADVASFWGNAVHNRLREHAKNLMGDLARQREDTDSVRHVLPWLSIHLHLARRTVASSSQPTA